MKKNLYKKFQNKSNFKENGHQNYTIEKSNILKVILSFLSDLISKLLRIVLYILIVALCSIGATYLFNYILQGGII